MVIITKNEHKNEFSTFFEIFNLEKDPARLWKTRGTHNFALFFNQRAKIGVRLLRWA